MRRRLLLLYVLLGAVFVLVLGLWLRTPQVRPCACDYTPPEIQDVCPNLEEVQETVPQGYELIDGQCVLPKEEEPEATPSAQPGPPGNPPTFAGSSTLPPQCEAGSVKEAAANIHVYRNGDMAVVKWIPTGGNQAHVYYKQVSSPDWQYSVTVPNNGYTEIHGLGTLDISFAVQQVNSCGGGVSVMGKTIVDGPSNEWVLYR